MDSGFQISLARKIVLILLGTIITCYAVSPKYVSKFVVEIEQQSGNNNQEDDSKELQDSFVSYEAVIPVTQFHLSLDPVVIFDLFVLEEKDFVPETNISFFVDSFRKILLSRLITPNAP